MAYSTSQQAGRLRELFEFTQGATVTRFTSAATDITALINAWAQVPIERSEIEQSQDLNRANITLKFPRTNSFAFAFLGALIDDTTSLTIRHETDDNVWAVHWKGRVSAASLTGDVITLTCEPITTSLKRKGLRATYQINCRHALYHSRGCKVDRTLFDIAGTVSVDNGLTITVPEADAQPDGEFTGGIIVHNNIERLIINHIGAQLTLLSIFDVSLTGQSVTLYPGCNRTAARCNDKFNNLPNHGGLPGFPRKNPFDGTSSF